jgi:hypothetical protein
MLFGIVEQRADLETGGRLRYRHDGEDEQVGRVLRRQVECEAKRVARAFRPVIGDEDAFHVASFGASGEGDAAGAGSSGARLEIRWRGSQKKLPISVGMTALAITVPTRYEYWV